MKARASIKYAQTVDIFDKSARLVEVSRMRHYKRYKEVAMPALHSSMDSELTASVHSEWLHGSLNPNQFALRYRDCPPEPPADLLKTLEPKPEKKLSFTTLKVVDTLLRGDLARLRSDTLADAMRISPTTLRRRLSRDGTNYQAILDAVRRYRCEQQLAINWVPGKCLAWDLGYAEVNSFYRAFRRWTGANYSEMKLLLI